MTMLLMCSFIVVAVILLFLKHIRMFETSRELHAAVLAHYDTRMRTLTPLVAKVIEESPLNLGDIRQHVALACNKPRSFWTRKAVCYLTLMILGCLVRQPIIVIATLVAMYGSIHRLGVLTPAALDLSSKASVSNRVLTIHWHWVLLESLFQGVGVKSPILANVDPETLYQTLMYRLDDLMEKDISDRLMLELMTLQRVAKISYELHYSGRDAYKVVSCHTARIALKERIASVKKQLLNA